MRGFYPLAHGKDVRLLYRAMKTSGEQILSRIDRRLKATGLSGNAASVAAGLSRDAIRSLRRQLRSGRQRGISTETLEQLAPVLQTTPEWLLSAMGPEIADTEEDHPDSDTVPVKGFVGAGAKAHFLSLEEGELDRVPALKDATPETVALEIRGDSLGELFDRWLVFFDDVRSPVTSDLLGKLCVVGLEDDRVLVKKIKRQPDGRYTLLSDEKRQAPMPDMVIRWAARVKNMVPR